MNVPLRASLDSLMKWYPISIIYLDADVEARFVTASCSSCSADEALSRVLDGTSLMWIRTGSQFVLKQRPAGQPRPTGILSGSITDSTTGLFLPDVMVLLYASTDSSHTTILRWCATNAFGYFCFRALPPGRYDALVRGIGYHTTRVPTTITDRSALRCDISLLPEEIAMNEVTVEGQRTGSLPAEGFSRGVYIRATPSDQNQYYLDGARIYNPAHLGGVLTTFNAEALNDVQEAVGGPSPFYGGQIGGILDFSMRDGTRTRFSGSVGTGSLGSQLSVEGPISQSSTFLVSARRSYPDALVPFLTEQGAPNRQGSSEIISKLTHRLSGSDRLSLGVYFNQDSYTNLAAGMGNRLSNDFMWRNGAVSLRWMSIAAPSLFLHASAVLTRYDLRLDHHLQESEPLLGTFPLGSEYSLEDISIRAHAEHYYDEDHTIRGGVELVRHSLSGSISAFSSQVARAEFDTAPLWELALYLQDQWRLLPQFTAELGARATTFVTNRATFSAVEPRFSLLFVPHEDIRWYASVTAVNQFLHAYRNSGVFLFTPPVFWYPSSERAKPTTALHMALGHQLSLHHQVYLISTEIFYRTSTNLHDVAAEAAGSAPADLQALVVLGTGRTYGLDLTLHKRTGDLTGSLRYSLSWARNTFDALNQGQPFVPRFDRRHQVHLSAAYVPNRDWSFGLTCALASDEPSSLAPLPEPLDVPGGQRAGLYDAASLVDLNGSRLPGFQRLELRITRSLTLAGMPCQISLQMMNAYGLLDPFEWELRKSGDVRYSWRARLRELRVFPLYPAIWIHAQW